MAYDPDTHMVTITGSKKEEEHKVGRLRRPGLGICLPSQHMLLHAHQLCVPLMVAASFIIMAHSGTCFWTRCTLPPVCSETSCHLSSSHFMALCRRRARPTARRRARRVRLPAPSSTRAAPCPSRAPSACPRWVACSSAFSSLSFPHQLVCLLLFLSLVLLGFGGVNGVASF